MQLKTGTLIGGVEAPQVVCGKMEDKVLEHVRCVSTSKQSSDVVRSLHELNIIVDSHSIDGARLLSLIPLEILFHRLATNDGDEVIKICTVLLKKLLNYTKPEVMIGEYEDAAVQGLNHPSENVREMSLSEVERCVQTVSGVQLVSHSSDLLNFVIRSLADVYMSCAKLACNILVNVSKDPTGLALLLDKRHQAEFGALMNQSDTIRFRVHELFVKIVACNHSIFPQVKQLFQNIASEVNSDDVLVQMNCIELLTDVVGFGEPGFQLPEEMGVNKKLYEILKQPETHPLSSLLIPAIIKYFGYLSMKKPQMVLADYPIFLKFIFNCIISSDVSLLEIALDTVGVIGSTDAGLSVLFQTEAHRNIIACIGDCLRGSDEDLKVHALDCLSSLFKSEASCDKNTQELIHMLYLKLSSSPLELLFNILKQPFNKVRIPCFKTFHSLVSYQWMLEDIKNIPGFLEYLLDRRTETGKECQELKYEVVKKITTSQFVAVVFDKPSVLKLRQFVREGPFYCEAHISVAMEGTQ